MEARTAQTRLLFVCLGNICRSPLAEGVFIHLAHQRGVGERFKVASAATSDWNTGRAPDRRSVRVARDHGVQLNSRARQVLPAHDFPDPRSPSTPADTGSDLILAMDLDNVRALVRMGGPRDRIRLLREFDPACADMPMAGGLEIPDPYHGDDAGFDRCYEMVHAGCAGLLDALLDSPQDPRTSSAS